MRVRTLTRRQFIGSLGLGGLAIVAAQQGLQARLITPTETETAAASPAISPAQEWSLSVGAANNDPTALALADQLRDFLAARLLVAVETTTETARETPDVIVAGATAVAGYEQQRLTKYFAPVTNWRLPLHGLTEAQLTGILSGRVTDWAQVGAPVAGRIARLDFAPAADLPLSEATPPVTPVASYATYEALVGGLDQQPFGFALVPLHLIDFRVQTLTLDDRDPLAGRGDLARYPLKRDLVLNWNASLGSGLRDALNAFASLQGYTPGDAPPGNPVNLTVAGDIIFGRTVHTRMLQYGDWAHPLRGVAPRLRTADLTIADLECSLSDNTEKPTDPFTFFFTTNSAAVEGLDLAGIDGVSLANNHSMNFGTLGLSDTITVLGQHGIKHFGGGLTLGAARQPGLFEVKGVTIAFLGYDGITGEDYGAGPTWAGTCPLDTTLLLADLAAAKAAGASVIVPFFHWSEEYVAVPSRAMRRIAHLAIDNGATMVIGSHPHWVQGAEWYRGVPILYSLGNFVFDQDWSEETKQGMFAEIILREGRPVRVRLIPVLIEDLNRPRILDLDEGLPVLQRVYAATDEIAAM